MASVKSTLRSANLRLEGLKLENGLCVDTILVVAANCTYDPQRKAFAAPEGAKVEAGITPASIASFVEANPPDGVTDLQVLLGVGSVVVTARVQAIIAIGVQATGSLISVAGTKVEFKPTDIRVAGGLGVPTGLVDGVLAKVNPLLDLGELPFPLLIDEITVQPEGVRVIAHVDHYP